MKLKKKKKKERKGRQKQKNRSNALKSLDKQMQKRKCVYAKFITIKKFVIPIQFVGIICLLNPLGRFGRLEPFRRVMAITTGSRLSTSTSAMTIVFRITGVDQALGASCRALSCVGMNLVAVGLVRASVVEFGHLCVVFTWRVVHEQRLPGIQRREIINVTACFFCKV